MSKKPSGKGILKSLGVAVLEVGVAVAIGEVADGKR